MARLHGVRFGRGESFETGCGESLFTHGFCDARPVSARVREAGASIWPLRGAGGPSRSGVRRGSAARERPGPSQSACWLLPHWSGPEGLPAANWMQAILVDSNAVGELAQRVIRRERSGADGACRVRAGAAGRAARFLDARVASYTGEPGVARVGQHLGEPSSCSRENCLAWTSRTACRTTARPWWWFPP